MKKLVLKKNLISGVPDIDKHHQALFDTANKVLFPEDSKNDDRSKKDLLEFLAGYVHYHFAAEEDIMKNAGIFDEKHIKQHDYMRKELAEIRKSASDKGELDNYNQTRLYALLDQWFNKHIEYWDIKMARILREKLGNPELPKVENMEKSIWEDLTIQDVQVSKVSGFISQAEKRARKKLK